MDYKRAAETRQTVRDFKKKNIPEEVIRNIRSRFATLKCLSEDIKTEYLVVDGAKFQKLEGHIGYSGKTFAAQAYLLLMSEVKPGYLENAGYIHEDMILHLTDIGIDSCWMTVNDEPALKKLLEIDSAMKITAVAAIGYGEKERKMFSLHIKTMSDVTVKSREGNLVPKISLNQLVYGDTWGEPADLDEQYVDDGLRDALYAASYAPTFLNRQPIRLVMKGGRLTLVKMMDSLTGELDARLNCGAVMLNFAAVLSAHRPMETKWVLGDSNLGYQLPADCEVIGYCEL